MTPHLRLARIAIVAVGIAALVSVVDAATGHMHTGGHPPAWVQATSWIFLACFVAVIGTGVAAIRRSRR